MAAFNANRLCLIGDALDDADHRRNLAVRRLIVLTQLTVGGLGRLLITDVPYRTAPITRVKHPC